MARFGSRLPRRKGPLPFRYVFLLTFVFFCFSTAAGLWIINNGIEPTLMRYAETQTRKIATMVINKAVDKKIASDMNLNKIIQLVPDSSGSSISAINFDTEIINRVKAETTTLVQINLKEAESGNLSVLDPLKEVEVETDKDKKSEGIAYYFPLGQATNNALLGNLGPRIPVRFNAIGDVRSDVESRVEEHGINNAWIKVYIHVEVNVQIIIPFATKITKVEESIPVAMQFIPGKVPQYFNGGEKASPSLQLPSE